jgi:MFS family permease
VLAPSGLFAQAYPLKPVRMIVGFAPGGGTDVTARAIVQQLSDGLGQRVVIDNRPGANGVLGTVMSAFAISIILVRMLMPFALRHVGAAQMLTYAMFVAGAAYCLFPLFHTPWTLAAISFVLGIGCGCGQPLSLTLVYNASPKGRAGEAAGMRVMANQMMHFTIPLLFGALGSVAGMAAVFITNAGCLAVGGYISLRSHARH